MESTYQQQQNHQPLEQDKLQAHSTSPPYDPDLKEFYRDLWATEARHGDVFKKMALHYFDEDEIERRNLEVIEAESKIIAGLEWRPSLH